MGTKPKTIAAGKFKAQCLALLDRVSRTREELVVTKRGKPVARLVPIGTHQPKSLAGSIVKDGDLLSPLDVEWDAAR